MKKNWIVNEYFDVSAMISEQNKYRHPLIHENLQDAGDSRSNLNLREYRTEHAQQEMY